MQKVVVDKPYQFVPPYPGEFWARLLRHWLPLYLRRRWGIAIAEFRGMELLEKSLAAGHGILLAPNHSRPCDPMILGLLTVRMARPLYAMASWHIFMENRLQTWLLQRTGAFSVNRWGMDREALKAATNILVEARRPLVIFAEGIITRTNDHLNSMLDGTAFIARSAAKQRAKATPPGQVVIHPLAMKYFFDGDLRASVEPVLSTIEAQLTWRPRRDLPLIERIARIGEGLLSLKEIEYMGRAQPGSLAERLQGFINALLHPLEKEWVGSTKDDAVVERVKRLRMAIVPDMTTTELAAAERDRRWQQLADIYLAQQAACYPPDYVRSRPTAERVLETVERFEEDLTDVARIHRPMRVVIQVGEAIEVGAGREKSPEGDPVMRKLEQHLQTMIDELGKDSPVLSSP